MTLAEIAEKMAAELRRLPCRVDHDKEPCQKCDVLALHDAFIRIVQVPGVKPAAGKP